MTRDGVTESHRIEREEFARGHIGPGDEPVEPRPAATMVMVRSGPAGAPLEALLLRRPETARFGAGAYVFPGGVVDPEDRGTELDGRTGELEGIPEPPALVAALREGFEETGLLPADRLPGMDRLRAAREELLAGELTFGELIRRHDLTFHGLRVAYFARWVTPPLLSRRYDARFFLAEHRGGEPRLIHDEHTEARWVEPGETPWRFEAGDLPMLYPTRKTMAELARFGSLDEAFETFRRRRVEPVRPRLRVEEGRVVPVLPGEPGYDEAGPRGPSSSPRG